ncbi:ribonuclease H-like domain-containing protein, partial [Tanacetum coccineum]
MTGASAPPALLLSDKLMTITNLTTRVPVLLDVDVDEMNYSSWIEPTPPTVEWLTINSIILTWIFTTLSKTLQQRLVVENPKTAKEAWDILSLIFNDNKWSRSIALKAELRSMKLGDLSIDAYFYKIKSIATTLSSLLSLISNDDVVNIALDGLSDKYQHVFDINIHREPFPDLKTVRSMLTTAEMRLKSRAQATYVDSASSSPMVLLANSSINTRLSTPLIEKLNKPYFNFNKGQETILPNAFNAVTLQDPSLEKWNMDTCASSHLNDSISSLSDVFNLCICLSVSVGDGHSILVTNSGNSILPTTYRPLHLNNILITHNIVKNLIHVRQFVGDNSCTVEFDAFDFSVKDFLTRRVLLRCDSTVDLYPVTKPSIIPHAFLTSQYTSHQRLGHPRSEVLRRVLSSNSILCNNEKSPIFVAWQAREASIYDNQISVSVYHMVIHFRVGTNPPTQRLNLYVYSVSPLPKSYSDAFNGPNWQNDMSDEYNALIRNNTWTVHFHQLDVKNAFILGNLSETVYMHQPPGFRDYAHPDYVCLLQRS